MDGLKGTVYGFCFSQCAITLGVVLFFPPVHVEVYTVLETFVNNTLVLPHKDAVTVTTVNMAIPVLVASCLAGCFASVTYHAHEQGLNGLDFQDETVEAAGVWDLNFWAFCLLLHMDLILMFTNPADLFGAIAATSFMVYFLYRACAPKSQVVNLTRENLNLVGYCIGLALVGVQIPRAYGQVTTLVMLMVVLDYFLGIGHTWDRQATIETVTNCRLFYVCCGCVFLLIMYCTWEAQQHTSFLAISGNS